MPRPSLFSQYRSLTSLNVTNGINRADKSSVFSVRRELRYYVILRSQFSIVLLYEVNYKGIRN